MWLVIQRQMESHIEQPLKMIIGVNSNNILNKLTCMALNHSIFHSTELINTVENVCVVFSLRVCNSETHRISYGFIKLFKLIEPKKERNLELCNHDLLAKVRSFQSKIYIRHCWYATKSHKLANVLNRNRSHVLESLDDNRPVLYAV
jgi:hypothetical protein